MRKVGATNSWGLVCDFNFEVEAKVDFPDLTPTPFLVPRSGLPVHDEVVSESTFCDSH